MRLLTHDPFRSIIRCSYFIEQAQRVVCRKRMQLGSAMSLPSVKITCRVCLGTPEQYSQNDDRNGVSDSFAHPRGQFVHLFWDPRATDHENIILEPYSEFSRPNGCPACSGWKNRIFHAFHLHFHVCDWFPGTAFTTGALLLWPCQFSCFSCFFVAESAFFVAFSCFFRGRFLLLETSKPHRFVAVSRWIL